MHVPVDEMADATAQALLAQLAGAASLRSIELPCALIVRASTAPPD